MCTAPTDTGEGEIAEMSVWDMEDEETGEIIEDAVLRIGPDGVEVQVDGDTTIEWSDLKVTNVKVSTKLPHRCYYFVRFKFPFIFDVAWTRRRYRDYISANGRRRSFRV
jgi:hypothetical protein